jgi:hypothetical protein
MPKGAIRSNFLFKLADVGAEDTRACRDNACRSGAESRGPGCGMGRGMKGGRADKNTGYLPSKWGQISNEDASRSLLAILLFTS